MSGAGRAPVTATSARPDGSRAITGTALRHDGQDFTGATARPVAAIGTGAATGRGDAASGAGLDGTAATDGAAGNGSKAFAMAITTRPTSPDKALS